MKPLFLYLVMVLIPLTSHGLGIEQTLSGDDLSAWHEPHGEWFVIGNSKLDPANEKLLVSDPGAGVMLNGKSGKTLDILSGAEFGDCVVTLEFMVPRGSNSGIYLQGRYEIQILDSWGVEHPKYGDCGGIYQRWNAAPGVPDNERGYEGRAPSQNASKAPGEWQQFEITFRAPRFDADGKKTENARFVKVVHNGVTIHENVEVTGPTRSGRFEDEAPRGPLMIQGDHGPVALRNIRVMETRTEE